jgi:DNA polymerase-3 subunit delta'
LAGSAALDRWLEVWENLSELFARAESAKLDRKQVVVDAVLTLSSAGRM